MQPAKALERHEQLGGWNMTHEGLDVLPVENRMAPQVGPASPGHQPAQHGLRAAVDALKPPAVVTLGEDEVVRLDDAPASYVDQMAA